ncbi:MAG: SDR family oxidoreductase [Pseudomonadota bacterium]|nr:SDR family oxidoreductase [Pseudomonadota bacterium]
MTSNATKKKVFLTGGAGVLGAALIDVLAQSCELICLTHKSPIRHPLVQVVQGDITAPCFGWEAARFGAFARSLDWIIHSAAITRLEGDGDEIARTNVVGTVNMLALAEQGNVPLYHISTAFAQECDYYDGVAPQTSYEAAKRHAETLVEQAPVRTAIFRPSIIIGDAHDGAMPAFQGFHLTLALLMSGVLPVWPSPAAAHVDVIARDLVAMCIKSALERELVGQHFNLCSGAAAPTVEQVVQLLADVAAAAGRPFNRPKCMHPDVFERLIKPVFLPTFPPAFQPVLERAALMCRYSTLRTPLVSSLAQLLPADVLRDRDPLQELRHSVMFLLPRLAAFTRMLRIPAHMLNRTASAQPVTRDEVSA